jgi:hypothetical protein
MILVMYLTITHTQLSSAIRDEEQPGYIFTSAGASKEFEVTNIEGATATLHLKEALADSEAVEYIWQWASNSETELVSNAL